TAAPDARTIDLRPVFDPTSIAIVGASARSWIAGTVRDNLRQMDSATRCHFVNPKYDELLGQPCYPSLDALPERPDIALVALNPLRAADVTQAAADAGIPAVIIPGGGVVEGGEAAAAMQAEVARIAREHGLALVGPNCMGVIDLTVNKASYIGDVSPYLPRGGVAGHAQSGSVRDAFVQSGSRVGFSRIISCGSEVVLDVCDYLSYCLDDPETTSVILLLETLRRPPGPGDGVGHPLPRGLPSAGAFPGTGRPGARARQADHGRQGRAQRTGTRGGDRALRVPGPRGAPRRSGPPR